MNERVGVEDQEPGRDATTMLSGGEGIEKVVRVKERDQSRERAESGKCP